MDAPRAVPLEERFRFIARTKAAAQAGADELSTRLQREVARWQREKLSAIVDQHLIGLRRAADPDLANAASAACHSNTHRGEGWS